MQRRRSDSVQLASTKLFFVRGGSVTVALLAIFLLVGLVGCSESRDPSKATSDPVAKVRLTRLYRFYQMYSQDKKKPPPNEQALKDFIRTLPTAEKEAAGIVGDDVDSLFVSPGDGEKYHIEYGLVTRSAGNRALAWEQTGKDGQRYVALTMGYVVQCDEERFQGYKKKK